MKYIFFILLLFSIYNSPAQSSLENLNFVLFSEVKNDNCDDNPKVFFRSPIMTKQIKDYNDGNAFMNEAEQSFKIFLDELVNKQYPQYYLKKCIPEVSDWRFFDEWNITSSTKLLNIISKKYDDVKVIETDFDLKNFKANLSIESNTDTLQIRNINQRKTLDPKTVILDAFYDQAQKSYDEKNYKKTVDILNKAKQNLEGKTNADFMILEAKARFNSDVNVTLAKDLLRDFINEASKTNDERITEAAQLLVQIETSDDFYDNGVKKVVETELIIDNEEILNKDFLNKDAAILKTQQFKKSWNNKLYKEINFESKVGKRIFYYSSTNTLEKVEYFVDDRLNVTIFKNLSPVNYYDNNEDLIQNLNYKNENNVDLQVFNNYKLDENDNILLNIENCEILEIYPISFDKVQVHSEINNLGMVKKVKLTYDKEDFDIISFNTEGIPTEKLYYKKEGKLKDKFRFNMNSYTWDEL